MLHGYGTNVTCALKDCLYNRAISYKTETNDKCKNIAIICTASENRALISNAKYHAVNSVS